MNDLKFEDHAAMHVAPDSNELKTAVLRAVFHGSKERTPFWHASTTLAAAQRWRTMADASEREDAVRRGSQPSQIPSRVAIRIDIWAWYQSGEMETDTLIDMSTINAIQRFFPRSYDLEDQFGQYDALKAFEYAEKARKF